MKTLIKILSSLKAATMVLITLYTKSFFKLCIGVKTMVSNPIGLMTGTSIITISLLTSVQKALILLFVFFILDFVTGILASWKEKREKEKEDPALKEESLISSDKLKLSAVKAFTYASSILGVWGIEKVFFIKTFKFDNISTENLTVTLIFIGFCCAIEFYSIVFENFKRMGFDIARRFISVVKNVKKILFQVQK
jgi:phage-related holin